MKKCDFNSLVKLLDEKLDLDGKLDVLCHLDECTACREAVYQISRDRDNGLYEPYPGQQSGTLNR